MIMYLIKFMLDKEVYTKNTEINYVYTCKVHFMVISKNNLHVLNRVPTLNQNLISIRDREHKCLPKAQVAWYRKHLQNCAI